MFGQDILGDGFQCRIGNLAGAAGAGNKVQPAAPTTCVLPVLVGHDLADHSVQFAGRVGRQSADGNVRDLVVIEIGVPIVGGNLGLGAPQHVDFGIGKMGRHRIGVESRGTR